ncbi:MAG: DsbA family protein [Myxococcales bacterium]
MNRLESAIVIAALLGGCHKSTASESLPKPSAPAATVGGSAADCTAEYPNLPLGELPEPARREFCRFAQDTLCYCGCPHMLAGCLKDHPSCPHASRMAAIALAEIAQGATAEKAGEAVTGYYDSFKPEARVKFDAAHLPCIGSADAKFTVVEFSDFDCPHCKVARPLLESLVHQRSDVRLCFMAFPLHPHSAIAAAAAFYAYGKGSFWKLHDLLFEDQEARATLDEASYTAEIERLGAEAGLDKDGLDHAIHDPAVADFLEKQKDAAHKLGVDGTPFLFVNGRPLPVFSPELLKLTLGDEQEWIDNGNGWSKD